MSLHLIIYNHFTKFSNMVFSDVATSDTVHIISYLIYKVHRSACDILTFVKFPEYYCGLHLHFNSLCNYLTVNCRPACGLVVIIFL
jgi:hypothetical protein